MDPFATAFVVAIALGLGFLALVVSYALLHRRLAPDSRLGRIFRLAIVWWARTLRYVSNAFYILGLAFIALFWYLTVQYS